jgi:hypothetical protein
VGNGRDIAAPAGARGAAPVGFELNGIAVLARAKADPLGRIGVDLDPEVERHRKHEPADEVGVLADQVDAARSPEGARRHAPATIRSP